MEAVGPDGPEFENGSFAFLRGTHGNAFKLSVLQTSLTRKGAHGAASLPQRGAPSLRTVPGTWMASVRAGIEISPGKDKSPFLSPSQDPTFLHVLQWENTF